MEFLFNSFFIFIKPYKYKETVYYFTIYFIIKGKVLLSF